ncbi:formyltransferase family protein [Engelhardtia mirabilis]|uniref:Linear gramicidin synthase subunit A n=1 Tax=Engelhardtia mirabilis TaxID=2528011 RepID=A0A518BER3_9BACT|nr:Linear gramicidin synthase subunit A [Planctomycetes bacterium Pla133]QDU99699.1 Linear gramicidin synthase subunit A [Planctomycetes bacterium Pla86]
MDAPRFAFLVLEEHPYGREMLRRILAAGFAPAVVVVESSDVADEEREKFLVRCEGRELAPTIAEQAAQGGIPVESLPAHRSAALMGLLGDEPLDLMVLGGTRIIRGAILDHPAHGVVNSHPGLLPDCRGSASPAWSVFHDIPVGASTHFCDRGIDTGDLLLRREFPVRRGMTYEDLCHGTLVLAGALMAEALTAYREDRWPQLRRPQGESPWPTFKNAPDEVLEVVRTKLADQTYGCYVD